jgi:hypothetical protein
MNPEVAETRINTPMVESIIQLIRSLPQPERNILNQRLAEEDSTGFTTEELMNPTSIPLKTEKPSNGRQRRHRPRQISLQ